MNGNSTKPPYISKTITCIVYVSSCTHAYLYYLFDCHLFCHNRTVLLFKLNHLSISLSLQHPIHLSITAIPLKIVKMGFPAVANPQWSFFFFFAGSPESQASLSNNLFLSFSLLSSHSCLLRDCLSLCLRSFCSAIFLVVRGPRWSKGYKIPGEW